MSIVQDLIKIFDVENKLTKGLKTGLKIKELEENKLTLADLRFQTRSYETIIPIVYGEVLLAGNIIWTSNLRSNIITQKEEADKLSQLIGEKAMEILFRKKPKETLEMEYKIDIAIAICEGKVDELFTVFIQGEEVDLANYNCRFYKGTQNQQPDEAIKKEQGLNAPAFNGICYIVFENFNLTKFGKNFPTFEFFIRRTNFREYQGSSVTAKIKQKLKGICLIPGTGEFAYNTLFNGVYNGAFFNEFDAIDGQIKFSNTNTNKKKADALVALDLLKEDLPNIEWVSLVIVWFASSTEISECQIFPAVEFNERTTVSHPIHWNVGGKKRWQVRAISKRSDGKINYGGTPADASIISILEELKGRGYKIMLYPMIFVDTEAKPWRGRITGKAEDVYDFFHKEEGYNNFILHYAKLAGHLCDGFIVGSEMKGLTRIRDAQGNFPAVLEFVKLAEKVKGIIPNAKLTYAGDWSEYHSIDGFFNMDVLWASPFIDFIGIDAYLPLTHTEITPTLEEIKHGWASGEGYDFYFNENGVATPYTEARFAWKNLQWFISNEHINIDGTKTAFKPFSKKIWFTEFGFPSVDLCTNEPNVFYDPTSTESKLPKFSQGIVDFVSQKNALCATLEFIEENACFIENAFAWVYDLRPYPAFPKRGDVWQDAPLWQTGHWLNGKLGYNTFEEITKELCLKSGILPEELEFENCHDIVEGFCINKDATFTNYIKLLCDVYFVKMVPSENGLKFKSLYFLQKEQTTAPRTLIKKNRYTAKTFDAEEIISEAPSSLHFSFIDKTNKYEPSNIIFNINENTGKFGQRLNINAPIVFSKERAMQIAKNLLKINFSENFKQKISVNFEEAEFKIGQVVNIENKAVFITKVNVDEEFNVILEGHNLPNLQPTKNLEAPFTETIFRSFSQEKSLFFALEMPNYNTEETTVYFFSSNLKESSQLYIQIEDTTAFLTELSKEMAKGKIIEGELSAANPLYEDKSSFLKICIQNYGKITSLQNSPTFSNIAIIGEEICAFSTVAKQAEGIFLISGFLRERYSGIKLEGFQKDDFLLLNSAQQISLPSLLNNFQFTVLGNGGKLAEIPFQLNKYSNPEYSICYTNCTNLGENLMLLWAFASRQDFTEFEKSIAHLQVEISFPSVEGSIIANGENFLLTKEHQIKLFGHTKPMVDFKVTIL